MQDDFPFELKTIRRCAYCSHDTNNAVDEMIHLANHSEDEKKYLQSGDIHRLIDLCVHDISSHERHRQSNPCCDYDTCLHNVKSTREKRMEIIISKLEKYIDPYDVRTVILPTVNQL